MVTKIECKCKGKGKGKGRGKKLEANPISHSPAKGKIVSLTQANAIDNFQIKRGRKKSK